MLVGLLVYTSGASGTTGASVATIATGTSLLVQHALRVVSSVLSDAPVTPTVPLAPVV